LAGVSAADAGVIEEIARVVAKKARRMRRMRDCGESRYEGG
jgi:hypothetical protein